MLRLVKYLAILHDAGEDVSIWKQWSLRYSNSISRHLTVLSPLINSAHKGVDLKSESPPFGILVVESKKVYIFLLANVLPLSERFVKYGEFREVLFDNFEYSRLPTADIPLDGDELRSLIQFFWRHDSILNY